MAFPPIGTNNGIEYARSACEMFHAISENAKTLSEVVSEIVVACPFALPGARVIRHLFNIVKMRRLTVDEPECGVCLSAKQDHILSCGHRFCERCVTRLPDRKCPLCKTFISAHYPCCRVRDSGKCCEREGSPYIYVPCGHSKALCKDCHSAASGDKKCAAHVASVAITERHVAQRRVAKRHRTCATVTGPGERE